MNYMIAPQKKHELRNKYDKYLTPLSITQQLLDNIELAKDTCIIEPCSSENCSIVSVLKKNGYTNVRENIYIPDKEETSIFEIPDNSCDVIITNTPYGKSIIPFVKKMKQIAKKMIIALYPVNTLSGTQRLNELWKDDDFKLSKVLMFSRPPFLTDKIQEDGKYTTGMNAYAWFIFEKGFSADTIIKLIDNTEFVNRKK